MKPVKLLLFCCVLFLSNNSLALSSTAAHKILFFGKDDRVRVEPNHSPWLTVGQLQTRSRTICTGTLVADDVVLTAAHCFIDEQGRFDPAVSFTVGLWGKQYAARSKARQTQVNQSFLKGLERRSDGIYIPPKIAAGDFAFVRLVTPLGKTRGTVPVFSGNRAALQQLMSTQKWIVTQGGYPVDDQTHLRVHQRCRATGLLPDGRLTHRCDTLEGNSGSPIFIIDSKGQATIVALQSSAPTVARRNKEDNMSISAPLFYTALQRFTHRSQPFLGSERISGVRTR
ncbi:trypsin-like serine protease [Neisseriaceae bacterium TC5R-5]|nr:trypsin-like serine protease [Neisseriaceae bacterium TC5R-5]